MNILRRLKAWWHSPSWSRWYIVGCHCSRCDWRHALRRHRGEQTETICANCHDWLDRTPEQEGRS